MLRIENVSLPRFFVTELEMAQQRPFFRCTTLEVWLIAILMMHICWTSNVVHKKCITFGITRTFLTSKQGEEAFDMAQIRYKEPLFLFCKCVFSKVKKVRG